MSWLVSARQYIPTVVGEAFGGGYFAGYISHTADSNPTHALIVAPIASGYNASRQFKTTNTATSGATSTFDGVLNTNAMVAAGIADHPAAQFCVNLSIGGFTDWYFPSALELDIAYQNLKPTSSSNEVNSGINAYSVPRRNTNRTSSNPAITSVALFAGGSESFVNQTHWSSTPQSSTSGQRVNFFDGFVGDGGDKTNSFRVRAFRRIAL